MAKNVNELPLTTYTVGTGKGETGTTGARGETGDKGENGDTPILYTQATSLDSGSIPTATIANIGGVNYLITFGLPLGAEGTQGEDGERGVRGFPFAVDEFTDIDDSYLTTNLSAGTDTVPYFVLIENDNRTTEVINDVNGDPTVIGDLNGHLLLSNGVSWIDQGPFTGVQGIQGESGLDGADGSDGVQGDQGDIGPTGADGDSVRVFSVDWYTLVDGSKTTDYSGGGGTEDPARPGDILFV